MLKVRLWNVANVNELKNASCWNVVGQVPYNIQGWLDKNKDPIQECIVQLMAESKEPLVSFFFKEPEEGF